MYIDYNKVRAARAYGKSSKVVVSNASFSTIPWEKANEIWKEAADAAEELATDAVYDQMLRLYEANIVRLNESYELNNPESGSYEGNWDDESPRPERPELKEREDIRRKAGNKAVQDVFIPTYILGDATVEVLPKLVDILAGLKPRKNESGLYSGLYYLQDHFTTPRMIGMLRFIKVDSKSGYLPTQYKAPYRTYSALVPLILYAHKLNNGIKYSEWDPKEIHYVVHHSLAEAMLWDGEIPSKDDLIVGRDQGLTVQSGASIGNKRSPISTFKLYATTGTCYQSMPEYVKVMLSQIWLAHPDNRTKYMVLDPKSWDSVPLPLISSDVMINVDDQVSTSTSITKNLWN